MPFKTRDIARDSWLLMVSAAFVLTGLAGLLQWLHYPLGALLMPGVALAAVLCGAGLLATVQHWPRVRLVAGAGLLALMPYALLHDALAGWGQAGVAWLFPQVWGALALAALLLVVALCLVAGRGRPMRRRLWQLTGWLQMLVGLAALGAWCVFSAQAPGGEVMMSPPLVVGLFALMYGSAMLAASARADPRRLGLGRAAVTVCLVGVMVSALAWYLLGWQQQQRLARQAEYLLDNVQLNAEQVMRSHLSLMQRMAERLDAAAGGLAVEVLDRDVANYLRDIPSLEGIGLLSQRPERGLDWRWVKARDDASRRWLLRWTGSERVRDWLHMSLTRPRLMVPDDAAPERAILAIAVPRCDQQLVAVLDMVTLMDRGLRLQLSGFQVNLSRDDEVLTSLTAPGRVARAAADMPTLATRHIGLPGGAMFSPSVHHAAGASWRQAAMVPPAVGLGGLMLTYLLVVSLGLMGVILAHSRRLLATRKQLEQQQSIQAMIAEEVALDHTLEAICRMLEKQLQGGSCSIMLADADGRRLRLVAGNGLPASYREAVGAVPIGEGVGACGSSAHARELVVCEDIERDPRWQGFRSLATQAGLRACWSYPVIASDGRLLGVFATYYRQPARPSPDELEHLAQAVDLVALAVEREQDRRSLWESEQRYRSLFVYNPDAVFSLDLQGHFLTANAHCAVLTGLPVEEIIGMHFSQFLKPDDLVRVQQKFDITAEGAPSRYELQIPHRDGSVRRLDVTNLPIVVDRRITGVYGIAKDVTERRERETRLRILERGVQASVNGVLIADAGLPDLPIVYANDTFLQMTGYSREEVIGRNCRFLQGPGTDRTAVAQIRQKLASGSEVNVTLRNYRRDGSTFWNDLYIAPVRDDAGEVTHFVGIQHDISERKAHEAHLAYHASHDALTGLANRTLLEERIAHDFELSRRHGHLLAVLFIDLDEFKPINDSLGHAVGDELLVTVAKRLSAAMRSGDTLARLGGDEFVVLLPDLHDGDQALQIAERLLTIVGRPYRIDEHELSLSCSIGIALSDTELSRPLELVQQADMAMYLAKQQGRNACQWYTPEVSRRLGDRVALRNELQEAIDAEAFELHYQPLIDRQGRVAGVEALLRWSNPVRGQVSPAEFIPLAEQTGQIIPISEWVLARACQDMRRLDDAGRSIPDVAVNLSPLQFRRAGFLGHLRHTLAETGLSADRLSLELTERVLMHDTQSTIETLQVLRKLGVEVAIDDFGTGFSSLSYLKDLPIDTVKIDQSFVSEVTRSAEDAAIIQGIISMAHHLGLKVVAEGIEHETQHRWLLTHGCDLFQGFHLARPMPLEGLIAFLDTLPPVSPPE
ncbi:MAG: EAL domain-containing protein [Pseudomonadota bacterium]